MTCLAASDDETLAVMVAALLGHAPVTLRRVTGGGNSRVHQACFTGGAAAVKGYPARGADGRDRQGAERAALEFLARHGVRNVPALLAADPSANLSVIGWIDGRPVGAAGAGDIDAALAFLGTLHGLRGAEGAHALPFASEACLSPAKVIAQIERRRDRLRAVEGAPLGFLDREMAPVLSASAAHARAVYAGLGLASDADLPAALRTLSPSDFGFHNAVRRGDGTLAFLDFEYFGWDDPVKATADFLLHPGMALDNGLKARFRAGAEALYGRGEPAFAGRLRASIPLYALRWCMILLNEFLPERWHLRVQAGNTSDRQAVLDAQLTKAGTMLSVARAYLEGDRS